MGWEGFGGRVWGGAGFDEVLILVGVGDVGGGEHGLRDCAGGGFGAGEVDGKRLRSAEV